MGIMIESHFKED
jgi:hypothetical protein